MVVEGRPGAAEDMEEGGDDDPLPDVLRWLISCDESGTGGDLFYGFGTLWMNWQRRGDFARLVRELRDQHHYPYEFKWNKTSAYALTFYKALVDAFFRTKWLSFHCLVVEKARVDRAQHGGSYDLARRKHFTKLLVNKISRSGRAHPTRQQTFRIWVDPMASSYAKADEVVEIISNHVLAKVFGEVRLVDKVITKDSKDAPSIQLCDLLLGAVMSARQGTVRAAPKLALHDHVAAHLGWTDLAADTYPAERKFNIWCFDDLAGPRAVTTRDVVLRYPLV